MGKRTWVQRIADLDTFAVAGNHKWDFLLASYQGSGVTIGHRDGISYLVPVDSFDNREKEHSNIPRTFA